MTQSAPRFYCTACDRRFDESQAGPNPRKPRCPACMRRSSVSEDDGSHRASAAPRRRRLAIVALATAALALCAALTWWLTARDPAPDPEVATPASLPDLADLDPIALADHATVLERCGATQALDKLFGERRPSPARAPHFVSQLIGEQLTQRLLLVIDEDPAARRRAPLQIERLCDGVLEALTAGDGAYLYPLELTLLVSALATELGASHDLVLLDPEEPTTRRLPVVAVRFAAERDDEPPLALDPRSGTLRPARDATGYGARLAWGELALMHARRALAQRDVAAARAALERAAVLVPELWTLRASRAELALLEGDPASARALARGLAAEGDHPTAWLVEARAELASAADTERDALTVERLRAIVDAFAFEATLCVELGQRLAALGRFAEARDAFELALDRDATVIGAHTGLARLFAAGDPERARQHLRLELGQHATYTPGWLALGALHLMYGQLADAERARERGRAIAEDTAAFDAAWQALVQ